MERTNLLTEPRIRAAKPKEKPYKLRDGRGLHLLVTPSGGRLWRLRYRHAGRESMLGLGAYPDVSLKMARDRRDSERKLIVSGKNPADERRAEKKAHANTFEAIAREWLGKHEKEVSSGTLRRDKARLESYIFPHVGSRPVAEVSASMLLGALRRVEARGKHETAMRTRELCGRVFRYAVQTERCEHDVSAALRGALTAYAPRSYAAITEPVKVGELLRAIEGYSGDPATVAALKLAPLVFVRPGELRCAEWSEFDLDAGDWRIPAGRMKMGEAHFVPLSTLAVAILRGLQPLTGQGRLVFPSIRSSQRPISENTLNAALRRLGYTKDQMTSHGFRAMASTLLNEQGFAPDVIELQLAHAERNKVRAAYNRAQRLAERRTMMQAWADYLDGLKAGGNVVAIRSQRQAGVG